MKHIRQRVFGAPPQRGATDLRSSVPQLSAIAKFSKLTVSDLCGSELALGETSMESFSKVQKSCPSM